MQKFHHSHTYYRHAEVHKQKEESKEKLNLAITANKFLAQESTTSKISMACLVIVIVWVILRTL